MGIVMFGHKKRICYDMFVECAMDYAMFAIYVEIC